LGGLSLRGIGSKHIAFESTATARLVLHIAIQAVRSAGGLVACWDTDSVFVIATPEGRLVPAPGGSNRTEEGREAVHAISFAEVEQLLRSNSC